MPFTGNRRHAGSTSFTLMDQLRPGQFFDAAGDPTIRMEPEHRFSLETS